MSIIDNFVAGKEILFEHFSDFIEETNMVDKPIDIWRNKIKNCKFDCWDCGYCDKIIKAKYGNNLNKKVQLVTDQLVKSVNKDLGISIEGLTSSRVKSLLNGLAKGSTKYLEVGSFLGATSAAALKDNNLDAYFIDTWEEDIQPAYAYIELSENSKEQFEKNIAPYIGLNKVNILQNDYMKVDESQIVDVDLVFYDGPHDHNSVVKFVEKYSKCLAENAILVFDDANWTDVVTGANEGISNSGLQVKYSKKVLNTLESERDWWNGIYIVVINK